jgi:amino acid permease
VLGAGLVILIVQVATLINMLQHEIKPIIESTNDTVNNLRGTTQFLSNNLVEPVMKMNEYLAGLKKFLDMMKFNRH